MKFISHRGNICGPNPTTENTEGAVIEALRQGYDVEIDVWSTEHGWFLGHDGPENLISFSLIQGNSERLWLHCKNQQAYDILVKHYRAFLHTDERAVEVGANDFPDRNWIWNHSSNTNFTQDTICVMPELIETDSEWNRWRHAGGVCSDHIEFYRGIYESKGA